ncbi:hypothetical protein FM038_009420 [Shewanella eurypsychrophilus]|uniref:Uncharacterized protein n=1 Tax=Shewanella eurypsychrophilus TaxID=2593656 RepID=A0ABX6V6Y7_9GAMM|nr:MULTISPECIES: hypothetical protein [Shewanella]QFU22353.1 hypothetical protein FS418_11000 [Shewanella sp. YLB-09]QPG57640.1 hypothetical protein FM038_009420 [Shewanella eurypsychrophilus]
METKVRDFSRVIGHLDIVLTILLALLTIGGGLKLLLSFEFHNSIWAVIGLLVMAFSLYIVKVLLIGIANTLLLIAQNSVEAACKTSSRRDVLDNTTVGLNVIKVRSFGLCSYCDEFETKNTLAGRYICSECQRVIIKLNRAEISSVS